MYIYIIGMMQFGAFMANESKERGTDALACQMTFDQRAILEVVYEMKPIIINLSIIYIILYIIWVYILFFDQY